LNSKGALDSKAFPERPLLTCVSGFGWSDSIQLIAIAFNFLSQLQSPSILNRHHDSPANCKRSSSGGDGVFVEPLAERASTSSVACPLVVRALQLQLVVVSIFNSLHGHQELE